MSKNNKWLWFVPLIASFLWRVRGGLRFFGHKAPMNKIWFAIAAGVFCSWYFDWSICAGISGVVIVYYSYQVYSWGPYIGSLIFDRPVDREKDAGNQLIDDLLYPIHFTINEKWAKRLDIETGEWWLKDHGLWFGFCGTTLTGLLMSLLWGALMHSPMIMVCGSCMGVCYWLGRQLNKLIPERKGGWGYGEWIYGFVIGCFFVLLCAINGKF